MTDFSIIKNLFKIQKGLGCTENEVEEAIKKFGNLPKVLIDYYIQLGKETALNRTQDFLLLPTELEESGDYIVFYRENQWVCYWCIEKNDISKEDPPVYYCEDGKVFEKECENLTSFLDSMAHLQGMFGLNYTLEEIEEIQEYQAVKVRDHFKKKNSYLKNWHRAEFYGNYDDCVIALIRNDDWYNVMYAAVDKLHYDEIDAFFKANIFL